MKDIFGQFWKLNTGCCNPLLKGDNLATQNNNHHGTRENKNPAA